MLELTAAAPIACVVGARRLDTTRAWLHQLLEGASGEVSPAPQTHTRQVARRCSRNEDDEARGARHAVSAGCNGANFDLRNAGLAHRRFSRRPARPHAELATFGAPGTPASGLESPSGLEARDRS